MSDDKKIKSKMREEWDRRISHDYRYWMSDGVQSDEEMWRTGERDLEILLCGLDKKALSTQTSLEIGCGVGRVLRAASSVFNKSIGVDVSQKAIEEATRLLEDRTNVELVLGDGDSLEPVESSSVDLVYTFAALSSMPVAVITSYLKEANRVLKPGANARLQVYLGHEQKTSAHDSIAIRSFDKGRFVAAIQALGFKVNSIEELKLPFEISTPEDGLIASIASITKEREPELSVEQIQEILIPGGESFDPELAKEGSKTEYMMAVVRATQLMDEGNAEAALEALEFAVEHYACAEPEVLEMIEKLKNQGAKPLPKQEITSKVEVSSSNEVFNKNFSVLSHKFSEVAKAVDLVGSTSQVELIKAESGQTVMVLNGVPLDQKDKPELTGQGWAERALNSLDSSSERLLVLGFAGGYHLEALAEFCDAPIHVLEPSALVLKVALEQRDLSKLLERLESISFSAEKLEQSLTSEQIASSEVMVHPQSKLLHKEEATKLSSIKWKSRSDKDLRPSIAVVGPIYGGSLPIAGYVYNALRSLGQRVHYYNLEDFCGAYQNLGKFVMNSGRKDALEAKYVEMLSDVVLEGIAEKPVDILISLAQAPLSGRALTEIRNRGIVTAMWFVEDCRRFSTWQEISKYYDYMFLIQNELFPKAVEAAGAGRGIYLPMACDPEVHKPEELTEEEKARWGSEVSFVGAGYNNRRHVFAGYANKPFKIWGTEWPACVPFNHLVQEGGRRLKPEEYIKIFNSTDINLNLHSSTERDGVDPFGDFVNPRTFELAATGAFQLTDRRELLPDLFEEGKEIATFSDTTELEEKIEYYRKHPEEREAISKAARERVLKDHTYEKRVQTMLDHIFTDKAEYLEKRIQSGPWPKTLKAAEKHPDLKEKLERVYNTGFEPTLNGLVADIQLQAGELDEVEQKLMFLHNLKSQIAYVNDLRDGKRTP